MPDHEGKCLRCGKTRHSARKDDIVICDCWRHCPLCGEEMTAYAPDLMSNVYGVDGRHDLDVLMVCPVHDPPFFSTQKPVEVVCA